MFHLSPRFSVVCLTQILHGACGTAMNNRKKKSQSSSSTNSAERPVISGPTDFKHCVHTGYDRGSQQFTGLPPQWQTLVEKGDDQPDSPTGGYPPQQQQQHSYDEEQQHRINGYKNGPPAANGLYLFIGKYIHPCMHAYE